jgi:hypothetical protein
MFSKKDSESPEDSALKAGADQLAKALFDDARKDMLSPKTDSQHSAGWANVHCNVPVKDGTGDEIYFDAAIRLDEKLLSSSAQAMGQDKFRDQLLVPALEKALMSHQVQDLGKLDLSLDSPDGKHQAEIKSKFGYVAVERAKPMPLDKVLADSIKSNVDFLLHNNPKDIYALDELKSDAQQLHSNNKEFRQLVQKDIDGLKDESDTEAISINDEGTIFARDHVTTFVAHKPVSELRELTANGINPTKVEDSVAAAAI